MPRSRHVACWQQVSFTLPPHITTTAAAERATDAAIDGPASIAAGTLGKTCLA
ncbi:MAG: hypothetical protein K6T86_09185 [Pirellulales bacterium]|nr:hypothetical protein [Pirellulales bacterium]